MKAHFERFGRYNRWANRQTHHRGQAHAMLSGTAAPPPSLDLVAFLPEDTAL
jgi:uncharacterized damage-inducible protein DinB